MTKVSSRSARNGSRSQTIVPVCRTAGASAGEQVEPDRAHPDLMERVELDVSGVLLDADDAAAARPEARQSVGQQTVVGAAWSAPNCGQAAGSDGEWPG